MSRDKVFYVMAKALSSKLLVLFCKFFTNFLYTSARVATVREKYLENETFSRSGKSQGILWIAREI